MSETYVCECGHLQVCHRNTAGTYAGIGGCTECACRKYAREASPSSVPPSAPSCGRSDCSHGGPPYFCDCPPNATPSEKMPMASAASAPGVAVASAAMPAGSGGEEARGLRSPIDDEETDELCAACEGTGAKMALDEVPCGCGTGCDQCGGSKVDVRPRPRRLRPLHATEEFINAVLALDEEVDFSMPLGEEPVQADKVNAAAWLRVGAAITAMRAPRSHAVQPSPPAAGGAPSDIGEPIRIEQPPPSATLQLYGQAAWHDDALIVGDEAGLLALRDTIERALADSGAQRAVYAGDGEGYLLTVKRADVLKRADHYFDLPGEPPRSVLVQPEQQPPTAPAPADPRQRKADASSEAAAPAPPARGWAEVAPPETHDSACRWRPGNECTCGMPAPAPTSVPVGELLKVIEEWETEAARRRSDANTVTSRQQAGWLRLGASFELHHAAALRSLIQRGGR